MPPLKDSPVNGTSAPVFRADERLVSLGRNGPGVGNGFLETLRTRFGGVLLACAQTASQFAVSRHAWVVSGTAQRLWMSIAGSSSGEA